MRETEFRGIVEWGDAEPNQEVGKWVYGSYIKIPDKIETPKIARHMIADDKTMQILPVKPETIGQYTGKNDKTKNKIFESDIVVDDTLRKYIVVWMKSRAAFCLKNIDVDVYHSLEHTKDLEICGNTHKQGKNEKESHKTTPSS